MIIDPTASLTLSSKEVARRLHLSVATINNWSKSGTLPAYQVGHSWIVVRAEFEAWLAATTNPTVQIPSLEEALAPLPPILRGDEVANLLQVSEATVRLLIEGHLLRAYRFEKLYRVPREALLDWFAEAHNVREQTSAPE